MHVLVTGSSGLIGSEAVTLFDRLGFRVTGIDSNMRAEFFGPKGGTTWNRQRLEATCANFRHVGLDIRDRDGVDALIREGGFELVIHAAAQPSHKPERAATLRSRAREAFDTAYCDTRALPQFAALLERLSANPSRVRRRSPGAALAERGPGAGSSIQ